MSEGVVRSSKPRVLYPLVGVIPGHGDALVMESLLEISTRRRLFRFSSGRPFRWRIESISNLAEFHPDWLLLRF